MDTETDEELIFSIAESISIGDIESAKHAIDNAINAGYDRRTLIKSVTDKSVEIMSQKFARDQIFLPTLMKASEFISELTDELYATYGTDVRKTVVIGTVYGDIHEIGKNLCAAALKSRGYRAIDIGCNVEPKAFIDAAKKENAVSIAVSAPMTTTRPVQRTVVDYSRENFDKMYVLIGGASCSQKWCDEIGADGYSSNWKEFISLVKKTIGD